MGRFRGSEFAAALNQINGLSPQDALRQLRSIERVMRIEPLIHKHGKHGQKHKLVRRGMRQKSTHLELSEVIFEEDIERNAEGL